MDRTPRPCSRVHFVSRVSALLEACVAQNDFCVDGLQHNGRISVYERFDFVFQIAINVC